MTTTIVRSTLTRQLPGEQKQSNMQQDPTYDNGSDLPAIQTAGSSKLVGMVCHTDDIVVGQ